jgi:aldose 1-epimerase
MLETLLNFIQRNFTVVSHTTDSITFSIVDPDGKEGFPGEVVSYITYTMTPYTWNFKMVALSTTKKTPIMLSSHVRETSCFIWMQLTE